MESEIENLKKNVKYEEDAQNQNLEFVKKDLKKVEKHRKTLVG